MTAALGTGGFGATYLGEDLLLRRKRRAIKEIPSTRYDAQEAVLLSQLQHPAIPDITDRFQQDGFTYLVLQFVGSRTLESERIASGGTIDARRLIPWMLQLCDALAYLHGRTPPVVHRDLKPGNVLLDERGNIALIDFGIAKESDNRRTRALAQCVSHGFSPPEQELGTGTDQRSDVYAVGATMYALATGRIPKPALERLSASLAGPELIPPSTLNPEVSPALEAAILKALELDVSHRQQSIADLGRTLRSLPLAPEPRSSWRRSGSIWTAAVAVVGLAAAAFAVIRFSPAHRFGVDVGNASPSAAVTSPPSVAVSAKASEVTQNARIAGPSAKLNPNPPAAKSRTVKPETPAAPSTESTLSAPPSREARKDAQKGPLIEQPSRNQLALHDIEFFNTTKDGARLSEPTSTFDVSSVLFVGWEVKFDNRLYGLKRTEHSLEATYIGPGGRTLGILSDSRTVPADEKTPTFAGRVGNSQGGAFALGLYTVKFYLDGEFLADSTFQVIDKTAAPSASPSVPAPGLADLNGTFAGEMSGAARGQPFKAQVTVTMAQNGNALSGTWIAHADKSDPGAAAPQSSGMLTGTATSPGRVEVRVQEVSPCIGAFHGVAVVAQAGQLLRGSYSGADCGGPLDASFAISRQALGSR